ncbi:MAG: hypothetical protein IJ761_02605 [Bacteroidales bacterium]|nr:hypothetical protein [Bacteroidales bacterium]
MGLFRKRVLQPNPIFEALEVDMHCHLVPNVDDGSKCLEETVECLNMLNAVGYKRVYITPHFQTPRFENDEDDITERFYNLKKEVADAGVKIELAGIGGEYRIDTGFSKRIESPRFLKVANKYVLVEFSLHHAMMGVDEMIFDLQMKGFELILAHPERYPYLGIHDQRMEQLKEQGVFFQPNVLSLGGFYGKEAMKRAYEIIDRGWAEFLGTDTHNVLYAEALRNVSHDRKVWKILEQHEFLNKTL